MLARTLTGFILLLSADARTSGRVQRPGEGDIQLAVRCFNPRIPEASGVGRISRGENFFQWVLPPVELSCPVSCLDEGGI